MLIAASVNLPAAEMLTLRWNELGSVNGRKATVVLSRGTQLKGTIEEVSPDALRIAIDKAPAGSGYSPGETTVPRKDVVEIRLRSVKGYGRLLGAAGGGSAVALGLLPWAISEGRVNVSDGARIAQWAGITAGAVVGGYLIGRFADTKETIIRITQEP